MLIHFLLFSLALQVTLCLWMMTPFCIYVGLVLTLTMPLLWMSFFKPLTPFLNSSSHADSLPTLFTRIASDALSLDDDFIASSIPGLTILDAIHYPMMTCFLMVCLCMMIIPIQISISLMTLVTILLMMTLFLPLLLPSGTLLRWPSKKPTTFAIS